MEIFSSAFERAQPQRSSFLSLDAMFVWAEYVFYFRRHWYRIFLLSSHFNIAIEYRSSTLIDGIFLRMTSQALLISWNHNLHYIIFLVACTRLFKSLCWSVGWSVGLSISSTLLLRARNSISRYVGWSVGLLVCGHFVLYLVFDSFW